MVGTVKGALVVIGLGIIAVFSAGTLKEPQPRQIMLWGLRMTPDDVVSVLVSGPSVTSDVYTWTKEEAELRQYKGNLGNRILDLYTIQGALVIRWKPWPKDGEDKYRDTCTRINLDDVSYVNVIEREDGKYLLKIEL